MVFTRRRWLLVALALAAIALVELVVDTIFDPLLPFPANTLVVVAVIAFVGALGAFVAFRSIDQLAAVLRQRNAELQASDAAARALYRVSISLATMTDLDDILRAVVDDARSLLSADVALLVLFRSDATLRLAASSGPADVFAPAGDQPGSDFRRFVRASAIRSHLAAPVQRGGRSIGTLAVGSADERSYKVDAVEILASLASQAAVAIENDRLAAQLRELAIRRERERIAREMHDGLAQVLGYVNTKSQAVEELLAAGRTEAARTQLDQLAAAARSVYVDVREAILGLTSPVAPESGLVGAIEEYARRFSEASKLATVVEASPSARAAQLAPEAQAQAFRIVQEALTNVRKHASALLARITLDTADDQLVLVVQDNGRGIRPGARDMGAPGEWPRYGIEAMRGRAAALGGTIDISWAEPGTRLELRVPLATTLEVG
jgi:signal transduction histidine kinase